MTTPLFPENNEKITIFQGDTGDCYMLAALDCLFHSGKAGLDRIKSMFTEYSAGIELRIMRNKFSENMLFRKKMGTFKGKYYHIYDENKGIDIFLISNYRLNIIDSHRTGVKSNSLAVKVLEHILPYYYDPEPQADSDTIEDADGIGFDSFEEHNRKNRLQSPSIASEIESEFFATIFGVEQFGIGKKKLGSIIIFKQDYIYIPIYVSMTSINGRHAYRIHSIDVNTAFEGGYEFVLLNPWNNMETVSYSIQQIREKKPYFVLFNWSESFRNVICKEFCIPNVPNQKQNTEEVVIYRFYDPSAVLLKALNRRFCLNIETETLEINYSLMPSHQFVLRMIGICNITSGYRLMELLYEIHAQNKELAKNLFQVAKDNMPSLFASKLSYYDVSCTIFRSSNFDFKQWFDDMDLPTGHIPGAQDIAINREDMVIAIKKLEVSYQQCASETAVNEHKEQLYRSLRLTVKQFTVRPGFSYALDYPEILEAYTAHQTLIETEANNHLPHMLRKNAVVQSMVENIHNFFSKRNSLSNQWGHTLIESISF